MAITKLQIEAFLSLAKDHPVIDVRSPAEFAHAHIPGAHNLPLFSNEERKVVGTAYKQESQQQAIKLGLEFFGKRMVQMVEAIETIVGMGSNNPRPNLQKQTILVHCWRGGMRSAGVAWLLDLYGYQVYTLVGGYKTYRTWALHQFEKKYPMVVLGGFTGSGKTEILQALAKKGRPVIDLEQLAGHKGSAFGNLGQPEQPSQEMFENKLARALNETAETLSPGAFIWIEDESQRIGLVNIPALFFQQLRQKKVYFLEIPFEARLDFIVAGYGKFEKEKLVNAIIRIKKRLGGLETKTAIHHLIEDNVRSCFSVLLAYYDKVYLKSSQQREQAATSIEKIQSPTVSPEANALLLAAEAVTPYPASLINQASSQ